jgi:hypothetical protein
MSASSWSSLFGALHIPQLNCNCGTDISKGSDPFVSRMRVGDLNMAILCRTDC